VNETGDVSGTATPSPPARQVGVGAVDAIPSEAEVKRSEQLLADLRRENEILVLKLAQVSQAVRGLVADLATSRRELRRTQRELDSLRAHAGSPGTRQWPTQR
jgi:hypothetical protein